MRGAAAAPLPTASGGEVPSAATVADCPAALTGAESVNRVIGKACGPITVTGDYHVNNGSLTLEAGAVLAFQEGTSLNIGYNDSAKLVVRGTEDEPVRFTSAGDKVPGVWKGVRLFTHADRSVVEHLIVEYAGAEREEAVRIEGQDVVWQSNTVRQVKGSGVVFGKHGSVERFAGNRFEHIERWPLSLGPAAAGGIDGASAFDDGAVVHVYGGTVVGQVTWRPAGAPYYVSEDVHVEGEAGARSSLTLAAGTEVRFGPEARLLIGYSQAAALHAFGVAGAPVVLTASPGDRWPGVVIYARGEASLSGTVFEMGGGGEAPGVLRVEGELSVGHCTFRQNLGGIALGARARVRTLDENYFEGNGGAALQLLPEHLGDVGSGNVYRPGERIELGGGSVEETATWRAQGAPIELLGDLRVDGRTVLTVEAGSHLRVKDKAEISVGARDNAGLRLAGTPDRPITIEGLRDADGSWGPLRLDANSRDSVLDNVRLRNGAGVTVAGDANARITGLSCERCSGPALTVGCKASVIATGVSGGETRESCPASDAGR